MPVTPWLTAPPPAELSWAIQNYDRVGPPFFSVSHRQWGPGVDDFGFSLPSGLEIDLAESNANLADFYSQQSVGSDRADFASVTYNNQWGYTVPEIFGGTFTENYGMTGAVLPIVDSDGFAYRASQTTPLANAFKAANPGVTVVYGFEWEGASDPTQPLGTHSNRHLVLRYQQQAVTMDVYKQDPNNPDFLITEPYFPPASIPGFRIILTVIGSANSSGTYISQEAASFSGPFTFQGAADSPQIGQMSRIPNQGGLQDLTFQIDDFYFDQLSIPLTDSNASYKHTRGMRVAAIPNVYDVRDGEAVYNGSSTVSDIWYVTTYQPPRYRLTYSVVIDETPPHRRVYPRDDGLAGGAPRAYPVSKAAQSSNRIGGSYL